MRICVGLPFELNSRDGELGMSVIVGLPQEFGEPCCDVVGDLEGVLSCVPVEGVALEMICTV